MLDQLKKIFKNEDEKKSEDESVSPNQPQIIEKKEESGTDTKSEEKTSTKESDIHRNIKSLFNIGRKPSITKRPYQEIDEAILKTLKLNECLTTTEVARTTRLNSKSALNHLRLLEFKGKVECFQRGVNSSWHLWRIKR